MVVRGIVGDGGATNSFQSTMLRAQQALEPYGTCFGIMTVTSVFWFIHWGSKDDMTTGESPLK